MSETRDEATGQFAPSTDGLFGQEAALVEAGYVPMPDPEKQKQDDIGLDVNGGAEVLTAIREDEAPIEEVVFHDANGERLNSDINEGPVEAVTAEQAAAALTAYREANNDSAAKSISESFADEIDALRGDAIKDGLDPKAAGIDKVSPTAEVPAEAKGDEGAAQPEPGMEGLDPEVQKALKIPAVKEALEREFAQADQVKTQFSQTLNAAQRLAQATLLELAPGLAHLQPHEIEPALQQLAQTDPGRAQAIVSTLDRAQRIEFAQQQQSAAQQQARQQQFEAQRQQFSRQADEALGPMSRAEKMQMADDLVDYVGKYGVSREQLVQEVNTNLALNHPAFQKMAADAVRYQRMLNAPKAVVKHDLPPVQRPGTAQRSSRSEVSADALERRFSSATGDNQIRLAAALTEARRSARNG
ncbi:hypothetical protein [Bradyrhizobium erythrophlei]|uniref:Uncharacterized protein n=1 Tax=Bradyrhizobium erythrophlei TaxID=1437360 RepID=A0A1H4NIB7_9BRAD|nr:hypothetical protein [Bradyrhizobium erythrophlei]SEB94638.1 hypothetical protein SAMN05444164_0631 [Bradyrhizobium erythrophlei]